MFLLAFLFQQHHVWSKCILRLFTICLPNQAPETRRRELEEYVYHLRIQAEVHAVTVADQEVSAFTKYRTMTVVASKQSSPLDMTTEHAREHRLQQLFESYPASTTVTVRC